MTTDHAADAEETITEAIESFMDKHIHDFRIKSLSMEARAALRLVSDEMGAILKWRKCSTCGGTGEIEPNEFSLHPHGGPCDECKGSGEVRGGL